VLFIVETYWAIPKKHASCKKAASNDNRPTLIKNNKTRGSKNSEDTLSSESIIIKEKRLFYNLLPLLSCTLIIP
jgi:hypothetical protein